jgi:hypothetical protein
MGITPKQVLHDVLTSHKHIEVNNTNVAWIIKDRFNCDDENLFAESSFIAHSWMYETSFSFIFNLDESVVVSSYNSLGQFFYELRGPPSLV